MARNVRVSNGHRRRQLRAAVLRDEDTCWLCGQWVDKTLHHHHPQAAEVDEVVPVSRGGSPYDRDNCRLAHRVCNQRRGAGVNRPHRPQVPSFVTTLTRADAGDGAVAPPPATTAHPWHSACLTRRPPSTGGSCAGS